MAAGKKRSRNCVEAALFGQVLCRCCYSLWALPSAPLPKLEITGMISFCHSWSVSSTGSAGWTMLEGCGSVSKAALNPKSRMLCPRQTAEWLLWLKRFLMAQRSAAAVASRPPGVSPGAEITFCVSQFSLARNFLMQSLPCLTLRSCIPVPLDNCENLLELKAGTSGCYCWSTCHSHSRNNAEF